MRYLFFALLLLPHASFAQSTSGDFSGGSIIIGPDTRTCDGTLAGALRYNAGVIEICNGADWTEWGG